MRSGTLDENYPKSEHSSCPKIKEKIPQDNHENSQNNKGHHDRIRRKFLYDPSSLYDYEIVELILAMVFGRNRKRDLRMPAKDILKKYDNLQNLLLADKKSITEIDLIGPKTYQFIKLIQRIVSIVAEEKIEDISIIKDKYDVLNYCKQNVFFEPEEMTYILFLDIKNKVKQQKSLSFFEEKIKNEKEKNFDIFVIRKIIKFSLQIEASALIIVCNDLGYDSKNNEKNSRLTRYLSEATRALDIHIHDNLVFKNNKITSLILKEGRNTKDQMKKFLSDYNSLKKYEIIDLMNAFINKKESIIRIFEELEKEYGAIGRILTEDYDLLSKNKHIGSYGAMGIKLSYEIVKRIESDKLKQINNKNDLSTSIEKAKIYFNTIMRFKNREETHVIFLDSLHNIVINEDKKPWSEKMQVGTVTSVFLDFRKFIRRALEADATGVIMAHNHPSGDPRPSQADIEMTHQLGKAAKLLNITIYDHIIVGANDCYSMLNNGLLENLQKLEEISNPDPYRYRA